MVEIRLDMMIHHVSAEYVLHGIKLANDTHADAILLELNTPGGLESRCATSFQPFLIRACPLSLLSRPAGQCGLGGILHPGGRRPGGDGTWDKLRRGPPGGLGGADVGKTMEAKIENDAAAYMRSVVVKRGRNSTLAEDAVRKSSSYSDKEALDGKLIDAVLSTPAAIFAKYDGQTIKRFNDATTTLHLKDAEVAAYAMPGLEQFFAWVADPNIAFILGALGLACLTLNSPIRG